MIALHILRCFRTILYTTQAKIFMKPTAYLMRLQPVSQMRLESLTVLQTVCKLCVENFFGTKQKLLMKAGTREQSHFSSQSSEKSTFNQWNRMATKVEISLSYGRSPQTFEPPPQTKPWLQSELTGRQPRSLADCSAICFYSLMYSATKTLKALMYIPATSELHRLGYISFLTTETSCALLTIETAQCRNTEHCLCKRFMPHNTFLLILTFTHRVAINVEQISMLQTMCCLQHSTMSESILACTNCISVKQYW